MTVKLMVLYTQPEDPAAFDQHYFGTHMPLVLAMPGLQRAETGKFGTRAPFYRAAELYFADRDALNAAIGSPEGGATTADYEQIAPEGSQILIEQLDD
ncbi:MAG: EthD family reductase [Streptosporangiaceae bacterium]